MRTIMAACALITTLCLGADAPPADPPDDNFAPPEQEAPNLDGLKEKLARIQEQTARVGERVARQAERAAALAQSKMALAQIGDEWEHADLDHVGGRVGFAFAAGRNPTQPLIVRTSETDATTMSNTAEDLAVMSRILTKTLGKDGNDSAMGIVLSAIPGGRRPQSVYLEGYGALFFINVRYPLVPPPAKAEEPAEKPADSTWEQTKRELYGPPSGAFRTFNLALAGEGNAEYDADQVADLKKDLIEGLKNASNIRALKPEESVTIVVMGSRSGSARPKQVKVAKKRLGDIPAVADGPGTVGRETVMTLRVKKADIDALAAKAIDQAEFAKRVSSATY